MAKYDTVYVDDRVLNLMVNAANELNDTYAKGTKRWTVTAKGPLYAVLDTQTGKAYGELLLRQAYADAKLYPTVYGPKKKPTASNVKDVKKKLKHDAFDDNSEDLEHYGILGMKWGVRRTPEQLGRGINKLEAKRKRAEKKYQKVERNKGSMTYAKYNKKSYKTSKKLDKAERRLMDFMKTNFELFGESQSYLNGKQADIGRKWINVASANPEEQFWMIMSERMRQRG